VGQNLTGRLGVLASLMVELSTPAVVSTSICPLKGLLHRLPPGLAELLTGPVRLPTVPALCRAATISASVDVACGRADDELQSVLWRPARQNFSNRMGVARATTALATAPAKCLWPVQAGAARSQRFRQQRIGHGQHTRACARAHGGAGVTSWLS
jgi:hypothetical protein